MLFDSHAHLNHPQFAEDWKEVLARAKEAKVIAVVNIGYDLSSSELAIKQCEEIAFEDFPKLFAAIAVHPHGAKYWGSEVEERFRHLAKHPSVVAIGEIGLDFHYQFSHRQDQFRAFEEQLQLAQDLNLPVILHIRDAHPEALKVIRNFGKSVLGVAHCFTGTWDDAKRWLDIGFYIGITGIATFGRKAENVREVAMKVPIDRILLETDSPYLAPVPYRGKRNEPAYLVYIAHFVAKLKGILVEELVNAATQNAIELFCLKDFLHLNRFK